MVFTPEMMSGYWQVDLNRFDKRKTVFSMGQKIKHFAVMLFGLCNNPATFEQVMKTILRGLTYE
jgi:hypothetical protein